MNELPPTDTPGTEAEATSEQGDTTSLSHAEAEAAREAAELTGRPGEAADQGGAKADARAAARPNVVQAKATTSGSRSRQGEREGLAGVTAARPHTGNGSGGGEHDVEAEHVQVNQGGIRYAKADTVDVRQGGIGGLRAKEVEVHQGGVGGARADSISVEFGAVGGAVAGEMAVSQGLVGSILARNVELHQTLTRAVVANEVKMGPMTGTIFLVARRVDGNVRALFDWRAAFAFGAAFGFVSLLFRPRRRK